MEKLTRFVAKHSTAMMVAWIFMVYLMGMMLDAYLGGILFYICLYFAAMIGTIWIRNRGNVLLRSPLQVLNDQCDPYPYLEETQRQRNYPGVPAVKLMRCITEACAMNLVGHDREAYHMLVSVDQKCLRRITWYLKAYYYYWVLILSTCEENLSVTEMWYRNMRESAAKIRNPKAKKLAARMERDVQLYIHMARKEYDLALQTMQSWERTSRYSQVINAWHCGKIYMAQGESAKAKEKLEFVVQNGNRLHVVTLAGELLAQIDTTEE